MLISTFSPFILLEGLYLALKDYFIQLKSLRTTSERGRWTCIQVPKEPELLSPEDSEHFIKTKQSKAKHKIILKKSTRKRIKTKRTKSGNHAKVYTK